VRVRSVLTAVIVAGSVFACRSGNIVRSG
jgi:hypothetical protein